MKSDLRRWLIFAIGAGLPLPFAFPIPGMATGRVPIGAIFLPFLGLALLVLGSREWAVLRRDRVAALLLAFAIVSSFSLPIGVMAYGNLNGIRSYVYQLVLLFNFVLGYFALRKVEDVKLFMRGFVASLALVSTVLTGYLIAAGNLVDPHTFHNSDALRAAISGWPNGFAVLITVAFIMALYVTTITSGWMRRTYIGAAVMLAACELLTFSKTGWIAAAIALWLIYLRYWNLRLQLAIVVGLALAFIGFFYVANPSFKEQIYTLGTLAIRVQFLAVVLTHVNPFILIIGSGSQSVETLMAGYAHQKLPSGISVADLSSHDEFLNVLVKDGLIALVLLAIAVVTIVLRNRRLTRDPSPEVTQLYRYWYAATLAIVVTLFAGDYLHYWLVGAMFWAMSGGAVHYFHAREEVIEPEERATSENRAASAT